MTATGIRKQLGSFTLSIDTFALERPAIYGLIGANGSGKSTLAKILAGLMLPDSGRVDTGALEPRDITLVTRKPYMMDDTVYNNLVYPLRVRKVKPDRRLAEAALERSGLASRLSQRARLLSGGEQQKLAFLRALIALPRLVIADEAMSALDIESLAMAEAAILDGQKQNPITWLVVSHEMAQVRRLADTVFFMKDGSIETKGDAEAIFASPANPHLERFLAVYGGGGKP